MNYIEIRGAKTHNLKNVNVKLPKNKLIVITGPSGSGKSSLAFDTLYAEGQRRYVESLSSYARQFLSLMEKPEVDSISGLSPAIAIDQKSTSHNPRSTVGTITEIYDYLRLLFARAGTPTCPTHGDKLSAQTIAQIITKIRAFPLNAKLMLCAPIIRDQKGLHTHLFEQFKHLGFVRTIINNTVYELDNLPILDPKQKHDIDIVIDRFRNKDGIELRIRESIESAIKYSDGLIKISHIDSPQEYELFSLHHSCTKCGYSVEKLEPKHFSFNSPKGACSSCNGLGIKRSFDPDLVIHEPSLSISQGSIRGFDHKNTYFYKTMLRLSDKYGFSLDTPWQDLAEEIKTIILYGSKNKRGKPYIGILASMMKRYEETESEAVREHLAKYLSYSNCAKCNGSRLMPSARFVKVDNFYIQNFTQVQIVEIPKMLKKLSLEDHYHNIAQPIIKEIQTRTEFLISVGLSYLSLERTAETLSGGESQRIRLASQLGSGLTGVLYVLDEPSIGLHPADNKKLIKTLLNLKNLGNTVVVIEHDEETMLESEYIIDVGPQAGINGGNITASGTVDEIINNPKSLTGNYLSGAKKIQHPREKKLPNNQLISIQGAASNNLKNINVDFPIGCFTCVTGVSGSGKSSLVNDTLLAHALTHLHRQYNKRPGKIDSISGLDYVDRVIAIDQNPIGRTPRSNPATYVGLFTPIRELFSATAEARARGYKPGRFSFNVPGGRCEVCQGGGQIKVEMHFLADIYVQCEHCKGSRYHQDTLSVKYNGKNIHEILSMPISDCATFFKSIPNIYNKCQTLIDVGLGYLELGQSATTLSGGEAQRIKLAKELAKRSTGQTLYILDEPTTGLHAHDINKLLEVLDKLKQRGNTLVVIEHHIDVMLYADWIIDLGPQGGDAGGNIVAQCTPKALCSNLKSLTGKVLQQYLEGKTNGKISV